MTSTRWFGGLRTWLRDAGLGDAELQALHTRLTEPGDLP